MPRRSRPLSFFFRPALGLAAVALASGPQGRAQSAPDYEQPPVKYSASTPRDAVTALQARIKRGDLTLAGSEQKILASLLEALHVPVASQIAVFSKTSLQRGRIRPQRPRVLYFSDTVYVGWVPGGLIEVTAVDPQLGPVFYSIELPPGRQGAPTIARDSDCLRCHGGTFVRDIPGVFARSVFPSASGEPLLRFGSVVVDDQTPFEQRWGGWYVTGYHGKPPHRGNAFAAEADDQLVFEPHAARPDELSAFFKTEDYLAPTSDVVALLVFEHQTAMQNALTKAAFSTRKMLAYQESLQAHFKEPVTQEPKYDSVKSVFASAVENVVDRLLFRGEAELPEGVIGHEAFRKSFAADAPRSRAGHALKDLRLQGRMFAQRCSYLIYSETFRQLPAPLKARIFARLGDVLRGRDTGERYAYLEADEKQRIYDILLETHPDAPLYWRGE